MVSNPRADFAKFESVLFLAQVTVCVAEVVAIALPIEGSWHPPIFRGQQLVVRFHGEPVERERRPFYECAWLLQKYVRRWLRVAERRFVHKRVRGGAA